MVAMLARYAVPIGRPQPEIAAVTTYPESLTSRGRSAAPAAPAGRISKSVRARPVRADARSAVPQPLAKAQLSLVTTARAAAARGVRGFALGHLERRAAAARGDGVRVVDLEARLLDRLQVVDARALQVRRAERIDDDADALALVLVIALDRAAVEAEPVLEAGAAAAFDRDTKDVHVVLGLHQLLDLRRCGGRQRDESVGALLNLHGRIVATWPPVARPPDRPRL